MCRRARLAPARAGVASGASDEHGLSARAAGLHGLAAEHLGRPELRVLDVRWRPDGTGRLVHAAGHIPTAVVHRLVGRPRRSRGRTRLVPAGRRRTSSPRRSGARASATAPPSWSTTTPSACMRHACWWSLRAYGFDSCRVLDGGFPHGSAQDRPLSYAGADLTPAHFTPRAESRTAPHDGGRPRASSGSPDVMFLDARGPGRVPGLRGQRAAARATSRARSTSRWRR